ncbi:MAG: hypothetical protein M1360_01985 [Candidatus Marsarchaeota archaeon]|jgi:uncharacterized membrane protein|nr:hypothetical protein [Candidatus Marsarchaeota archaeon]MCL5418691.1 hypothetical protein [Candidatus Marsarchaeota archaeon]
MKIFNIFGKKDAASDLTAMLPYKLSVEMVPYRIYANRNSSATMMVRLQNNTGEILLTSLVAELPQQLGFDELGVSKQKEVRVGEIAPHEEKEIKLDIYGGLNSDPGEYTVSLTAIAHYRDYGHVLNAVKKRTVVNVVKM